jgi:hypothetical protein
VLLALPRKRIFLAIRRANTGNAGALARTEREARTAFAVYAQGIERAAHACAGEGARAPSDNGLVSNAMTFWQRLCCLNNDLDALCETNRLPKLLTVFKALTKIRAREKIFPYYAN